MARVSHFRLTPPVLAVAEKHVVRGCINVCLRRGWWVGRLHAGTFKSFDGKRCIRGAEKGTPDYAVMHAQYPGFLLEVKRPGGRLSPEQEQKHYEIRLGFGLAIVTVDDAAELEAWLDSHERTHHNGQETLH